jgi:hypothetical protein
VIPAVAQRYGLQVRHLCPPPTYASRPDFLLCGTTLTEPIRGRSGKRL